MLAKLKQNYTQSMIITEYLYHLGGIVHHHQHLRKPQAKATKAPPLHHTCSSRHSLYVTTMYIFYAKTGS
jgi:hypothetical protein